MIKNDGKLICRRMGHDCLQLHPVTSENVHMLKSLNSAIFPVSYTADFYKKVVKSGNMARLAVENGVAVGAVCARVEVDKQHSGRQIAYVMTLGCLAPWRRKGIGATLLEHIIYSCIGNPDISEIVLHVSISNEEAIKFYDRFGFKVVSEVKFYYKRVVPPHAYLLKRVLRQPASPVVSLLKAPSVSERIAAYTEAVSVRPQVDTRLIEKQSHFTSSSTRIKSAAVRHGAHNGWLPRTKVQCSNLSTPAYKCTAKATLETRASFKPSTPVFGCTNVAPIMKSASAQFRNADNSCPISSARRGHSLETDTLSSAHTHTRMCTEKMQTSTLCSPAMAHLVTDDGQCCPAIARETNGVVGGIPMSSESSNLHNRPDIDEESTDSNNTHKRAKIRNTYIDLDADTPTPRNTPPMPAGEITGDNESYSILDTDKGTRIRTE